MITNTRIIWRTRLLPGDFSYIPQTPAAGVPIAARREGLSSGERPIPHARENGPECKVR